MDVCTQAGMGTPTHTRTPAHKHTRAHAHTRTRAHEHTRARARECTNRRHDADARRVSGEGVVVGVEGRRVSVKREVGNEKCDGVSVDVKG